MTMVYIGSQCGRLYTAAKSSQSLRQTTTNNQDKLNLHTVTC